MRLLRYVHDVKEYDRIRVLLESGGIPTYRETSGFNTYRSAVFVCINSQYDDAVALLSNSNHVVAQPVDPSEFAAYVQQVGLGEVLKGALRILVFLVVLVGVSFTIYYWWNVHS